MMVVATVAEKVADRLLQDDRCAQCIRKLETANALPQGRSLARTLDATPTPFLESKRGQRTKIQMLSFCI